MESKGAHLKKIDRNERGRYTGSERVLSGLATRRYLGVERSRLGFDDLYRGRQGLERSFQDLFFLTDALVPLLNTAKISMVHQWANTMLIEVQDQLSNENIA
ncbi:hypothetical protein Drorol1_Dr00001808 [Drosera rotundifolia]